MSTYRTLNTGLTDPTVTQIMGWINQIRAALPFLISLNKADKAGLAKIGKKRYAWSKEAFEFAQLFPNLLPQNRTFVMYSQVKRDYEVLGPVFKNLSILHRALSDSMTQLGANYYQHARDMYDASTDPTNDNEPGILFVREELAKQFAGQGLQTEPEETIEETVGVPSEGNGTASGVNADSGTAPA